ncbi:E3 ubiquitin-protein ligase TRIM71-like [Mya arenaria]|uniref:E3 ubiquitin-protein ligase TRIM71-like n=1 Tax=Mya arenaria TaxID=6604 RepID=UPI0022E1D342|nr:E3 ubiquitin-protein ligase TRIM71-like [Mya arenaria]
MEVSGKRPNPELDKASADATIYCQPCGEGRKRAVAHGFCQTCEEYMCGPCIEAHKRFKLSRNHIMLSKDKMPSFYPSTKLSEIGETEYCKKHPKEMIKLYCPTHGNLGCGDCVVIAHRTCKVDYIAEVAKDFVTGNEFRELQPSIKRKDDILSGYISNVEELFGEVIKQSKDEIDKLRKFRAEINTFLDRREKELLDNIQKAKTEDENVLTALKTDCESAKTALEAMRTELSSSDVSINQRYVAARRTQNELRVIHVDMGKMACRIKARKYRFFKGADTERLLGSKMGLGTLDMAGEFVPVPDLSTVTWKKEADIPVRESLDKDTCSINSSAQLLSGLLLLADYGNICAKLVDANNRIATYRLQLPGEPWDVCVLPDDKAAVTLPYKSIIQLLSTKERQLSCEKEIKVSGECFGIAFYNNRLYVSYISNPRIEVMTLDGHIINTFQKNDEKKHFTTPFFLILSPSTSPTLYVSDYSADRVFQLSLDGKVLREFRDKQLIRPVSVLEDGPGQKLVSGQGSHNVMLLNERGNKMTEVLGQKDGLFNPTSISFNPHTRAIVIGMDKKDQLKVFRAI